MHLPKYHFRPVANWMNDPNGLCQVNGWYHMFYQYNPHGDKWGDIHWGHARSRDMLHWEELPIAMAPDGAQGEIHCFSGGCCKDEAGKPHFFYTSVGRKEDDRDCVHGAQQWMAEPVDEDLTQLRQSSGHAVTDAIHGGMHVRDWRDPCVIRHGDQYLMTLGGCVEERGCVLLYTSPDMKNWTYRHILAQSDVADGKPWECPNFFEVDGRFVLFYSPCDQVMVRVGTLDEELRFHAEYEDVLDPAAWSGYYAPQAFRDEQGRTLLFGWMPECDGRDKGWSGVMSLPRELRIADGRLTAWPVEGVDSLAEWHAVEAAPGETLLAEDGRHLLLRMNVKLKDNLTLRLFAGETGETSLRITPEGEVSLNRERSCGDEGVDCSTISRRVSMADGRAEIFLALDGSAIECMVNGAWISGRVYQAEKDCRVYLVAHQPVAARVGVVK